jgi:hypothetical protein
MGFPCLSRLGVDLGVVTGCEAGRMWGDWLEHAPVAACEAQTSPWAAGAVVVVGSAYGNGYSTAVRAAAYAHGRSWTSRPCHLRNPNASRRPRTGRPQLGSGGAGSHPVSPTAQ